MSILKIFLLTPVDFWWKTTVVSFTIIAIGRRATFFNRKKGGSSCTDELCSFRYASITPWINFSRVSGYPQIHFLGPWAIIRGSLPAYCGHLDSSRWARQDSHDLDKCMTYSSSSYVLSNLRDTSSLEKSADGNRRKLVPLRRRRIIENSIW